MKSLLYFMPLALLFGAGIMAGCQPAEGAQTTPGNAVEKPTAETNTENTTAASSEDTTMKKAMFGAGCFWGVEATFREVPGVIEVYSGYSGGQADEPTYKMVCAGNTGHAEVVEVTFDPAKVTYETLLDTFWKCHNPTHVNRQGVDFGNQYRSAIFYYDDEQKSAAEKSKAALDASGAYTKPIATEITAASTFWKAEEYHQRYLEKHGMVNCHVPNS